MAKQRYLVVVVRPPSEVAPSSPDRRSSLLLPFHPEANVSAFIEELWRRLSRHGQGIPLTPDSHHVVLRLEDATGPTIDTEDILSDVVVDAHREKLYAVFSRKDGETTAKPLEQETIPNSLRATVTEKLSFRVITPSSARNRAGCPVVEVPLSSTIRELHSHIAKALAFTTKTEENVETLECNCNLAAGIARGPSEPSQFRVVHGNSVVEQLPLATATKTGLKQILFEKFGHDLEMRKRVSFLGAESDHNDNSYYMKTPIVSICSKQRHVPARVKVDFDETGKEESEVLDLHPFELPIHPACFDITVETLGLRDLATNGIVDIFATPRVTVGEVPVLRGKSAVFRSLAHWEPSLQSDRGMAMFLSALRVFTSLVQDMEGDDGMQDSVLRVFDLLTQFPPALRCLHTLIQGKTPTVSECAAISQATLAALNDYLSLEVIDKDSSRILEGSRLFFGYILDSAKSLSKTVLGEQSSDAEESQKQNGTVFLTIDLRDHKTLEPVFHALQTSHGLMEASLFRSLQSTGVLAESHMQSFPVQTDIDPCLARVALQSGGTCAEVTILSLEKSKRGNQFSEASDVHGLLDLDQLSDLGHLADLCERNNLAVHRPSQLDSAVAPRLAFDRNAHLAVYTGEKPCGEPGESSIIFRPQHGEETVDPAVLEQLIDPIVKGYETDGTSVFDSYGGATVRWLQEPDEILVFCVDSSQSMASPTDFEEVNRDDHMLPDSPDLETQAAKMIEAELYGRISVDDTEKRVARHEFFHDMIATIAATAERYRDYVTRKVLGVLTISLSAEIIQNSEELDKLRQSTHRWNPLNRQAMSDRESDLKTLQLFWAGVQTYKEDIWQFLRRRATCVDEEVARNWTWSSGDPIPVQPSSRVFANLESDIVDLPDHLRCPISHQLMRDAVKAADGHTYSRAAISRWFTLKKSSPLHGSPLDDTSLSVDAGVREQVESWITGGRTPDTLDVIIVVFSSRIGSFSRTIACSSTLKDLYKLAYRGLMAKFDVFELSTPDTGSLEPTSARKVSSIGLQDGNRITIHLPEDTALSRTRSGNERADEPTIAWDMCLVKVFSHCHVELFRYWVKRNTQETLNSIIWKYWRYQFQKTALTEPSMVAVSTNVANCGDGWYNYCSPDGTSKLATYFNRDYCFGRLEEESVFSERNHGLGAATPEADPRYLVLKVMIREQKPKTKRYNKLTRLDFLKQMFEALVNRMLAYSYKTHVGLISFSSEPQVDMRITHVLENFRRATNALVHHGDTALWDALALADDQIEQHASKYPEAKKRIIVISDGKDTKSLTNSSHGITSRLYRGGVSVDSVCLGKEDNADLVTLSNLLGSYSFSPKSLSNALAISEMEPFLSLTQRPTIKFPLRHTAYTHGFEYHFLAARRLAHSTVVTDDRVPPIKEHPSLDDEFVQLKSVAAKRTASAQGKSSSGNTGSKLRILRLMNEMKSLVARVHPKYDIYVSTTDMSFWKVVMEGPDESPYSDGTFLLYLHAENRYPAFAPKARFLTKIKHPNINAHGRICHSIFDRDWTSDTTMATVLNCVYGLLFQPEYSDPANTTTILAFHVDQADFAEEVRKHVRKHTVRSRGEWRTLLLEEDDLL